MPCGGAMEPNAKGLAPERVSALLLLAVLLLFASAGVSAQPFPGPFYAGDPRVLWVSASGQVSLWNLGEANGGTYHTYGPISGMAPVCLTSSPTDGLPRLLWSQNSGQAMLTSIQANGTGSSVT